MKKRIAIVSCAAVAMLLSGCTSPSETLAGAVLEGVAENPLVAGVVIGALAIDSASGIIPKKPEKPIRYEIENGSVTITRVSSPEGELTIPRTIKGRLVTRIRAGAFAKCSKLTRINIPDSITSIGHDAFYNCSNLKSFTIPDGVTSIEPGTFRDCSGLTSITIPNSVISIEHTTFKGCSNLTSITIPGSVTSMGGGVFEGCSGLASIAIPNSVTSIDGGFFSHCSSLSSITIPGCVTSIGERAFWNCNSLRKITIPDSITSIGGNAFQGCSSLTAVTFLGDLPKAEKDIFKGSTPIIYRKPEAKGWSRTWCARLVNRITIQDGANINGLDEIVGEVDFNDPETRKKIVADAIYKNQSEQRVSQGEERLHLRNHQMPYSGWWKEMRGKGNGYKFAALVQYKDGKLWTAVVWERNGEQCPATNVVNGNGDWVRYNNGGAEIRRETYKDGVLVPEAIPHQPTPP
jgi:hypothetical protein